MAAFTASGADDSGLIHDTVTFDPEDLDDAFTELDARWGASQT